MMASQILVVIFALIFSDNLRFSISEPSQAVIIESKQNHKASAFVRKKTKGVSMVQCNLRCMKDDLCESTNFYSISGAMSGVCEQLASDENQHETFVEQENATFTRLKKISLATTEETSTATDLVCNKDFSLHESSKTCFSVRSKKRTWSESKLDCESISAKFAKIETASQMAFIRTLASYENLHFGMGKRSSGSLMWSDKTLVPSSVVSNLPLKQSCEVDDDDTTCCAQLRMQLTNVYNAILSESCSQSYQFICQQQPK